MIYFAGPLFNEAERAFNSRLTAELEAAGFQVFLPQRDGVVADRPPYSEMSRDQRRKVTFEMDRDKIMRCDVFLFVLDGRVPDEGACVELGMAYTHREATGQARLIVGLQTDNRAAFMAAKLNLMIRMALDALFESRTELIDFLKQNRG